jgi:hypothetical protein
VPCLAGRATTPTAAIADSQSVRAAETVARTSGGYDAGKNVNRHKRHIVVDTTGLLLVVLVTAASVQDRHGARTLLHALRTTFPTVATVWVDGGYSGRLVDWATTTLRICVEVVAKLAGQVGFHVLHRRSAPATVRGETPPDRERGDVGHRCGAGPYQSGPRPATSPVTTVRGPIRSRVSARTPARSTSPRPS